MIDPSAASQKNALRREVLAARRNLPQRTQRNAQIGERLREELEAYPNRQILIYISVRDEVETMGLVDHWLRLKGEVVIPYCLPNHQLGLFALRSSTELRPGAYGIREPRRELWSKRDVEPESLDLALLPGVAFDIRGNRLGHGKGYFDRLLAKLRPDCRRLGVAFECQIVPAVPTQPHDIPVHAIVTEERTIDCGN